MAGIFYIAWCYVTHYRMRALVLAALLTIAGFLPAALELFMDRAENQLTARAQSTPLIIGSKGSGLDLVMNGLYFRPPASDPISLNDASKVEQTGLAFPVPMHIRFRARGFPIVGTILDYFEFRDLTMAHGRWFGLLGECVLGATVASRLGLRPGDSLLSSPENLFDIAGVYPLKMSVVGVLAPSGTPDDEAVFTDYRTSWIIMGLGHGHQDLATIEDKSVILKRSQGSATANAKLYQYGEITRENVQSFHFHGDEQRFPLTAAIALPDTKKSEAILRGRYGTSGGQVQAVKPDDVITGLLSELVKIKSLMDAILLFVAIGLAAAVILIFYLSLKLREAELETIHRIGASRFAAASLIGAEFALLAAVAGILMLAGLWLVNRFADDLLLYWVLS